MSHNVWNTDTLHYMYVYQYLIETTKKTYNEILATCFTIYLISGHKHGKICYLKTLVVFLENIHKVYFNVLNL
jgi:hypothetical protein